MIAVGTKVRITEEYLHTGWRGREGEVVKAQSNSLSPYPYRIRLTDGKPPFVELLMKKRELEVLPAVDPELTRDASLVADGASESRLQPKAKVYLAGPMTGYAEFNFPAFKAATAELRARGYAVISPAEMDLEDGFEPSPSGDNQDPNEYAAFLARDIQRIAEENIDAIVVLPGWEKSGGVATEVAFVRALGKPVLRYPGLAPVDPAEERKSLEKKVPQADRPLGLSASAMLTEDLSFGYGGDDTLERTLAQQAVNGNPKDALAQQEDRVPLDLLEPAADEQIARVMAFGAKKYGRQNYVKAPVRLRVYIAAIQRHINALKRGEDVAPDSGLHHMAHIGADTQIVLAAEEAGTLIDDRRTAA